MRDKSVEVHKTLFFITWIILSIFMINFLYFIKGKNSNKVDLNLSSLSPAGIQVLSNIKKGRKYIQSIYKSESKKNLIIVMIKPFYWEKLKTYEKKSILSEAKKEWKKIYKKDTPGSFEEPEVSFANN